MAFITRDEVKSELRIPSNDTEQDDFIDLLILAVLSLWDKYTFRTWASAEHTEYHNSMPGNDRIFLENYPVQEGSISVWDDPSWVWDSGDLLTLSDDYRVDYTKGIIYRDGGFYEGKQSVKVVYTSGYADGNFPNAYKQILRRQACYLYNMSKSASWGRGNAAKSSMGGSQSFNLSMLEGDLLPDFKLFAELESRRNV